MITIRATRNWIVGLTRQAALVERFSFLKILSFRNHLPEESCTGCAAESAERQFVDKANEVLKVIAALPQTELDAFKK